MLDGKRVDIKLSDNNFAAIPADLYTVQVTDVNLKSQFNTFKNIEEDILNYEFTVLSNKTMEVDGVIESLRGRKLWKRTSLSLNPKSWLSKLACAAKGHDLTKEEQAEFQPEDVIDCQCDVLVEIQEGTGKNAGNQYNNIISFAKTVKELTAFDNDKSKVGEPKESKPIEPMTVDEADDFIKELEKEEKAKK